MKKLIACFALVALLTPAQAEDKSIADTLKTLKEAKDADKAKEALTELKGAVKEASQEDAEKAATAVVAKVAEHDKLAEAGAEVLKAFPEKVKVVGYEEVIKQTLSQMQGLGKVLKSVEDEKTAKSAAAEIEKIGPKMKSLQGLVLKLGEPGKEIEDALKEKYQGKLQAAATEMIGSIQNAAKYPEIQKALMSLR